MSYCRWSTDNFNCDIYAYESDSGFQIHICSGRYKGEIPKTDMSFLQDGSKESISRYMQTSQIQSDYLKTCGTKPINLPLAGESFTLPDLQSFYDKMVELKEIGYRFPDYVLECIKEEISKEPNDERSVATDDAQRTEP